jgi:hypothetical protein
VFLLARARALLARHRWVRWAVVLGLAAVAAWTVLAAVRGIEAARDRWGTARSVYVSTGPAQPGEPLHAERRQVPVALVPTDAAAAVPAAAVARQHIGTGEVVTAADVGSPGAPDWVPPGWVALAVPLDGPSPVAAGDAVRVFAEGSALADGTVLRVHDGAVLVCVPAESATGVSGAIAGRSAVLGRISP